MSHFYWNRCGKTTPQHHNFDMAKDEAGDIWLAPKGGHR